MMRPPMPYFTIFFFFCPLGWGYFWEGAQGDRWAWVDLKQQGAYWGSFHSIAGPYFLRLTAALDDEDIGVDVLHAHPVGEGQRGVRPDPVHDGPQLHQEGHKAKPGGHTGRGGWYGTPWAGGGLCGPIPYPWKRKRLRWLYFLVRKLPRMRVG